MKTTYFCGFNGFRQFGSAHANRILEPTEFHLNENQQEIICSLSWAFNAFASNNELHVLGFIGEETNSYLKKTTESPIKQLASNDNYCLVLLENGSVYKLNIRTKSFDKLNCFRVETTRKRTIFGGIKEDQGQDQIEHITCGTSMCVAINRNNEVFNVPSKIYQFPKHEKVKTLVSGYEHALVLTSNGDLYSWGSGLRGQLGNDDMKTQEIPTLIDALAGIKILNISAGGWHSAAISAFGDVYTWGSNINGQLGLRVYKSFPPDQLENKVAYKNPTVYPLPQLAEICCCQNEEQTCNAIRIFCGARHTLVQSSCGKWFCTGWNEHGQLGIKTEENFKDQFEMINFPRIETETVNLYCGPWCTVFIV